MKIMNRQEFGLVSWVLEGYWRSKTLDTCSDTCSDTWFTPCPFRIVRYGFFKAAASIVVDIFRHT